MSQRAHARTVASILALASGLTSSTSLAAFTETLPAGTGWLDLSYSHSMLTHAWGNDGKLGPLIDPIRRFEPGGGMQGILTPHVNAQYEIVTPQLQLGVLSNLTIGVGVPIVLGTTVNPTFDWQQGDYQPQLGRPYSEDDFWQWAASMGQPKPGSWHGNRGTLSDVVIGARFRFTDYIAALEPLGLEGAVQVTHALRTGRPADPEEIVSAGTTMWELHAQGELGAHLGFDKRFKRELNDRLRIGVEGFYEAFFARTLTTPSGTQNPLLLAYKPYVGDTYRFDGGDFVGFSVETSVVPWKGSEAGNWMTKGDAAKAVNLPPMLNVALRYTHTHIFQSDWQSNSDLWDWDREKLWRPGYKNTLTARVTLGLFRIGVPLQLYGAFRSVTLLPGKNTRAADVITVGLQAPFPIW